MPFWLRHAGVGCRPASAPRRTPPAEAVAAPVTPAAAADAATTPAPAAAPVVTHPRKNHGKCSGGGGRTARRNIRADSDLRPGARKGKNAADRVDLDTTTVTGNRELPKVMYVVPWKRSDIGDLIGRPANSLLDEVLAPVDRNVFRREIQYYQALKPDAAAAAPQVEK